MKSIYKFHITLYIFVCASTFSCVKHLEKLNENPNGADPAITNPSLVLSTVLSETGKAFVALGYGDIAGVMQYTQKDGWGSGHNNYDWGGDNPWVAYFDILRNNQYVYNKAIESKDEFLQGITLVIKSMVFGLLTDLYGDVPYTSALHGDEGGQENTFPTYDDQKSIYEGILADLKTANTLLSKSKSEYSNNPGGVDLYYNGDPGKWRRLANSLALRYYMRISEKLPVDAKTGIEMIVGNPTDYPIITSASDDAAMAFAGNSNDNSWPNNVNYDSDSSNYRRLKMCNTFVTALQMRKDPRLGIFAAKVKVFLDVNDNLPARTDYTTDTVINGENRRVRYLSPDILSSRALTPADINQDPDYVGLAVALTGPQAYNLSPDLNQASRNPHVSWLNDIYRDPKGPLLKARLMSAAEVHFIIAEAKAAKGWTSANAETEYYAGIRSSFDTWGLGSTYTNYITQPDVVFVGTQKQIMEQKWIANWTNATESWFDFRRTGFPNIHGVQGRTIAPELPVRFYYPKAEQNLNSANEQAAANKLEVTPYSGFGADGSKNSAWSKMWLLQGTGKPW
ncbi:MAG: SusD/RagB family nutrient-binding outer membrane lipoprotein [Ginsengibacter sp.]